MNACNKKLSLICKKMLVQTTSSLSEIVNSNICIFKYRGMQHKNKSAVVVIRQAKNLPKVGLYSMPYPYIIIKTSSQQSVSAISPSSCNPYWNYETKLTTEDELQPIKFYIYNSNPNDVDELLAYGSIEFEKLMTIIPTQTKVMLKDAKNNRLRSWLVIEHSDQSPPFQDTSSYNSETAIRINFLRLYSKDLISGKWLEAIKKKILAVSYHGIKKEISENHSEISFKYNKDSSVITVELTLDGLKLQDEILIGNIEKTKCLECRFYVKEHEIYCDLCVRIVKNGFFSENLKILSMEIKEMSFKSINKNKNWMVLVHSFLNHKIIKSTKTPISLHVQNNTALRIDYFDDNDYENIQDLQPISTYVLNVNALSWSKDYDAQENISIYNQEKGISLSIKCGLSLIKSIQDESALIPVLANPEFNVDTSSNSYRINSIRLLGACFSEIFTQKTVFRLMYVNRNGLITHFPSFQIRNSTQYNIQTRQTIKNEPDGWLYLATYDHFFGNEKQAPTFLNHYICKISVKDLAILDESPILFNEKFLSFAKKITLTKVCKKYDQMVRDKTMKITLGLKQMPTFEEGQLTLHNCMLKGERNQLKFTLVVDSNEFTMEGATDRYMLQIPQRIPVKSKEIIMKLEYSGNIRQLYSDFQEVFGTPSQNTMYKIQFPVSTNDKLIMIYSYKHKKIENVGKKPNARHIQELCMFEEETSISIKLKSITLKDQKCEQYVLRVNRGQSIFESQVYNPGSTTIKFMSNEKMFLRGSTQQSFKKEENKASSENRYIFFNLYCHLKEKLIQQKDASNEIEQQLKKLIIFTGHFDVRCFLGKGHYEVVLKQHDENQKEVLMVFELLNNQPLKTPEATLKLQKLESLLVSAFRPAYKHYLVAQANSIVIGIFEGKKDTNIGPNLLKLQQSLKIKRGDCILWKVYSSLRSLTKELFWSGEKQLIGSGILFWSEIQEGENLVNLRFRPTRELKNKFNSNKLSLIETQAKIQLRFASTGVNSIQMAVLQKKTKNIELDVLNSGAGILNILEITPASSVGKNLQFCINQPIMNQSCKFNCFAKLPLYQQYLIDIRNMKLNFEISKSLKVSDNYVRKSQTRQVNLRGKHLKTNCTFGINLNFPGICSVKADLKVISNKFTNNPIGKLTLSSFELKGQAVRGIEIYPLQSPEILSQPKNLQKIQPLRFGMQNQTKISLDNKQIRTRSIQFSLYIILVLESKEKVKTLVQLAKLDIDKLEEKQFKYEWLVEGSNRTYILNLNAQYHYDNSNNDQKQAIHYYVQNGLDTKKIALHYNQLQYQKLHQNLQEEGVRPDRKLGYRVVVDLPDKVHFQKVYIILEDETQIPLLKYEHNQQIYILKGYKELNIRSLKLIPEDSSQFRVQRIQELEEKNFYRRFLINRDNRSIAYLNQEKFAIADIEAQTMTVKFSLDCLRILQTGEQMISNKNKKILWMSNNPHDQILTRKLGIFVKHGQQCKPIRIINQFGFLQGKFIERNQVVFGYKPEVDEIQIYLYIHHNLNEGEDEESLMDFEQKLNDNWMRYLPVAYGKISIEKIGDNANVGCEFIPIINTKPTLDSQLNKAIIKPNIGCFGQITMEKHRWGYINFQFISITPVELELSSEKELLYFVFSIQNTKKEKVVALKTEARSVTSSISRYSYSNDLRFKFMEDRKGEMYSLKVIAKIISISHHYTLFEKRADITEMLTKPTKQPSNFQIKVKTNESSGLSQPVELNFQISNQDKPYITQSIEDVAKQINTYDIVKFENHSQGQLIGKLIECQQKTHLFENAREVKESLIYSKQQKHLTFMFFSMYLMFQNDSPFLSLCIEALIFTLSKFPNLLQSIHQKQPQLLKNMYTHIKSICSMKQLPLDMSNTMKVSEQKYKEQVLKSKKQLNNISIKNIIQILSLQKKVLYTPQEIIQPSKSYQVLEQALVLLAILCRECPEVKELIVDQIGEWNDYFMFKEDPLYLQYITLVEGLLRNTKGEKTMVIRKGILDSYSERKVGINMMVEIWYNLAGEQRANYSDFLAKSLGNNLTTEQVKNNEILNATRIFINYLVVHHITIKAESLELIIQKCLLGMKHHQQIRQLSSVCELIIKLKSIKLVSERDLGVAIDILKKKKQSCGQKNKKMVLINLLDRLIGRQSKGEGTRGQQQKSNKNKFYKKYLITS